MKRLQNLIHIFFLWTLVAMALACVANPGIEAGNPELKGKTLTINVAGSDTSYVIQVIDEDSAAVSQVEPDSFETVSAPYSFQNNELSLTAGFSDGNQILVAVFLDGQFNVLEVQFALNGLSTPVDFGVEDEEVSLIAPQDAALALAAALCERIVDCNTVFDQAACETEAQNVPGLSQEFGNPEEETLGQAAGDIANGNLLVDENALQECLSGIAIVTCDKVQKFFNDEDPPNYNQIKPLIPKPICAQGILRANGP